MDTSKPKQNSTFPELKLLPKPRVLRQTWLKDVGYHEAPHYLERMGLFELEDFLEVTSSRFDYVKITTPQVLYSPPDWIRKKNHLYKKYQITPYLDHTYFKFAFKNNCVEHSIENAKTLGFDMIEFMNTSNDVSSKQWKYWRNLTNSHSINFMFEYHPLKNWNANNRDQPSTSTQIIEAALPFFEDGAQFLVLDHEEFELQDTAAEEVFGEIVSEFGLERLCFEVTSPREGLHRWREDLADYIAMFGPDCNVCNIMPSQVLQVEPMRDNSLLRQF